MKIVKIGDCYINLNNVTHVAVETTSQGVMCNVYFNCQVTDRSGCNGIQASKTFTAAAGKALLEALDGAIGGK